MVTSSPTGPSPLLTPGLALDFAQYLGVSKDTVYAWVTKKGIPRFKAGRSRRVQAGMTSTPEFETPPTPRAVPTT